MRVKVFTRSRTKRYQISYFIIIDNCGLEHFTPPETHRSSAYHRVAYLHSPWVRVCTSLSYAAVYMHILLAKLIFTFYNHNLQLIGLHDRNKSNLARVCGVIFSWIVLAALRLARFLKKLFEAAGNFRHFDRCTRQVSIRPSPIGG